MNKNIRAIYAGNSVCVVSLLVVFRTDVCFHIVKDNKIVDTKSGMKILDAQDSKLETLKNKYTIASIGVGLLSFNRENFGRFTLI